MWNDRFLNPCSVHARAAFDPITATAMALSVGGSAVQAAGTIMGGNAAADAGNRGQQAQNFKAQQEDMAAVESRAIAQRSALEKKRETGLVLSKLQANAAASGGGADDSTVLGLASGIAGRGEYESLLEMYKGENRARGLEDQAIASRMTGEALKAEGEAKKKASYFSAAGTLIGGAGSAFKTYNKVPQTASYG